MEHITDIMASSSASTDLLNLNIEVTQVAMSNDYKTLRVFWLSHEIPSIDEQKLLENAKILRHELSQLRIISSIPQILFVKDKRQLLMNEVEEILKTADMGVADCDPQAEPEDEESELPPKSTSVFGLHRAKIMEKVRRDMRKHCSRKTDCQPKDTSLVQSHAKYKHLIKKFVNKAS
ncbi:putative ribosome-binding factor A, mitochondrial isoform X2 [Rhodnius prolixus]